MDGNNSLKRTCSAASQDDRVYLSDYFLTREEVDVFKDEVKSKQKSKDLIVEFSDESDTEVCNFYIRSLFTH
jgi:Kyakuja-Dileera-Zisupton transposase